MNFCQNLTIELLKAFPFLVIASITGYIAWKQYKIENTKLQAVRFEHRNNILMAVDQYHELIYKNMPFRKRHYDDFHNKVLPRRAFFSDELCKKIEDLEFAIFRYQFDPENIDKKFLQKDREEIIKLSKKILKEGYAESRILNK